ncbi:MAG: hypothetical protein EAZ07_00370 [Cytophagales bacterium]|nr:MAG: hypothetical protein EAZ07_00370 [Cytophagales bacterium]
MKFSNKTILGLALCYITLSCKPDKEQEPIPTPVQDKMGTVEIIIEPKFEDKNFKIGDTYTTVAKEEIKINDLKFFLSNIGLVNLDASESKSYPYPGDSAQSGVYLVNFVKPNFDAGNGGGTNSYKIQIKAKEGEYADLRFDMIVPRELNFADITKNPYPVQAKNGMYWSWNSGFKFMVVNGTSNVIGGSKAFHLSLGLDKSVSYLFKSLILAPSREKIIVSEGKTTTIKFNFDISQIFQNTDGSAYSLKPPVGVSDAMNPAQVHGGFYSNILRANTQQCMEMVGFSTK